MRGRALAAALVLYGVWTLATWFLEGRIETLLRPEATLDRATYALIANILIGTGAALAMLARILRWGVGSAPASGFAPVGRIAVSVACGLALGASAYALQGGPLDRPVIVLNAFAQVLVVSIAEVVVCWAVVASTVAAVLGDRPWRFVIAAAAASLLFGAYHFAHSPPFDSWPMVALLTAAGLATSAFFLVARDLYGTIAFHNFLGVFGVVAALSARGELGSLAELQPPLLGMAALSLAALFVADRLLIRGRHAGAPWRRTARPS